MVKPNVKVWSVQKFDDWPYVGYSVLVGLILPVCFLVMLVISYYDPGKRFDESLIRNLKILFLLPVWQIFLLLKHIAEKTVFELNAPKNKQFWFVPSTIAFCSLHMILIAISVVAIGFFIGSLDG